MYNEIYFAENNFLYEWQERKTITLYDISVKLQALKGIHLNYLLIYNNQIVYIGVSSNIYQRLVSHKNSRKFQEVVLYNMGDRNIAFKNESHLINLIKPQYNYRGK